MTENELRKQQVGGFYRDIEVTNPSYLTMKQMNLKKKERALEGVSKSQETTEPVILRF